MKGHRCWAEIDTSALRANARTARARLPNSVSLLAVIKANGYGHGLSAVASALAAEVDLFGVANLQEAKEARRVVPHPLLILGPALPEERPEIVRHHFIPTISSHAEALAFSESTPGEAVALNCKIDTGMGRMGILERDAIAELQAIAQLPNTEIHSISTHLPSADADASYTRSQLARFDQLVGEIRAALGRSLKIHALPSAGVLAFGAAAYDIVRAGLMLYGVSPQASLQDGLQAALTLKTRVVLLRELPAGASVSYGRTFTTTRATRVATLSVGYADGFPRALSNRGAAVLLRGRRCPVLGRVTMDLTMVDATAIPDAEIGDECVLIGHQGDQTITPRELAERACTIPWDIFTGIGSRVARVYH